MFFHFDACTSRTSRPPPQVDHTVGARHLKRPLPPVCSQHSWASKSLSRRCMQHAGRREHSLEALGLCPRHVTASMPKPLSVSQPMDSRIMTIFNDRWSTTATPRIWTTTPAVFDMFQPRQHMRPRTHKPAAAHVSVSSSTPSARPSSRVSGPWAHRKSAWYCDCDWCFDEANVAASVGASPQLSDPDLCPRATLRTRRIDFRGSLPADSAPRS